MAHVAREHHHDQDTASGMGFFIGVLVIIILGVLFFVYALPAIRDNGGTNVNVPDRINVDVNRQ